MNGHETDHSTTWIQRMRLDASSSLLSTEDIESLARHPIEHNSNTTLLMRLGDIAKPGEIIELSCKKAQEEGVASCIFINKDSGTVTLTPNTLNTEAYLVKIEVDEEIASPEYLKYFLSENLIGYVGAKLDFVTKDDICSIPVVIPSLQAQRVICSYLNSLDSYKRVIQDKTRRLNQIKPLNLSPSQLLGHALYLIEETENQSSINTDTLPAPIAQALSALDTADKAKRFLCSQYIIEVLIQFHVVSASSFAVKLLGANKLEDAYKTFQNSKWMVTLSSWKNIFEKQVNEFEKSTKDGEGQRTGSAFSVYGEESFFAFSDMFSRDILNTFNRLIELRNEYFGHPSSIPDETMEIYCNNVRKEVETYLAQTSTLWKWLSSGICIDVPTNEACELVANIESFSGSLRNSTKMSMIVPPGLLARNTLVFYPRNKLTHETIVQSIPFTFVDRISTTVHGLYFFSRIDKDGRLVFQSYSELKESTKHFSLEDPRISLLTRRIFSSQIVLDSAKEPSVKKIP
jgi:hypothetical protein